MATDRKALPQRERGAYQAWIRDQIHNHDETQSSLAMKLGLTQPAVGKMYNRAEGALSFREGILAVTGMSLSDFLARWAVDAIELPPMYSVAVGMLWERHKRDFTAAAEQHFQQFAAHGAEGMSAPLLADMVYEFAQGEKGKSLPNKASQDLDDGTAGAGRASLKRKKGAG